MGKVESPEGALFCRNKNQNIWTFGRNLGNFELGKLNICLPPLSARICIALTALLHSYHSSSCSILSESQSHRHYGIMPRVIPSPLIGVSQRGTLLFALPLGQGRLILNSWHGRSGLVSGVTSKSDWKAHFTSHGPCRLFTHTACKSHTLANATSTIHSSRLQVGLSQSLQFRA